MIRARRAALLLLVVVASTAAAAPAMRAGRPPVAPPSPSTPPDVTRAEAEAVLEGLRQAWKREDRAAIEKAYDAPLAWHSGRDAGKLLLARNYFDLSVRIDREERLPDGGLRLGVVLDMTSREVTAPLPMREKRRWTMDFARRPDRGVVIAFQAAAETGLLPRNSPWREDDMRGTVSLLGAAAPDAHVDVDIVMTLTNASSQPASELGFALHPFSSGLAMSQGEAPLSLSRTEASLDAWRAELRSPVAPGASLEIRFVYSLRQTGEIASCAIGPDLVRLYGLAAWLPEVQPMRAGRKYELTVVSPDGVEASMPGRRDEMPPVQAAKAVRFSSEIPSAEVPLVALRGTREEVRLGPGLVLDVVRGKDAARPDTAISHVTTLAAFLEDRLGACPVSRLALVEARSGGFREGTAWMALPDLAITKADPDQDPAKQSFLFLGLCMARLWIVHDLAPSGWGAPRIADGLCDHLVGAWADAAVKKGIALRQRGEILGMAQLDPGNDRALLPDIEDRSSPPVYLHGMARLAFDGYEALAGADAWRKTLRRWADGAHRGDHVSALMDAMSDAPERAQYVEAFFRRIGACQIRIADVRLMELGPQEARQLGLDPTAWKRVEVEVDNVGLGPVPVEVRMQIDQDLVNGRVVVGQDGSAVVSVYAAVLPQRVWVDPQRVLWQANSEDDSWPPFTPKHRDEFGKAQRLGRGTEEIPEQIRRQ